MPIFSSCNYPGCGIACEGRFCPTHVRAYAKDVEARRKDSITRGSPAWWKRTRKRILVRDKVCQQCGLRAATDVDHIVPRFRKGSNKDDNLQGLCKRCHSRKTVTETGWGKTRRQELADAEERQGRKKKKRR